MTSRFYILPFAVCLLLFSGFKSHPSSLLFNSILASSAPTGVITSAPDTNIVLLLHFDGSDGATNFPDTSLHAHSPYIDGTNNAQIDTAQSKFGGASLNLPDGLSAVLVPANPDFLAPSGTDFTLDFWLRLATLDAVVSIIDFNLALSDAIAHVTNLDVLIDQTYGIFGTRALSANTWYHIELDRSGTTWFLFIDGVGESASDSGDFGSSINLLVIGGYGFNWHDAAAQGVEGWIDEFRFIRGIAAHTNDFTPPSSPYPDP
ncbi:MAG: hypothetical protein HY343_05730 [Lentisphaerae bacterium]|nr:hypothetical protein [Lentisphaerota bacterium]